MAPSQRWSGSSAYRRRTARPVTVLVGVLLVAVIVTWTVVLTNASDAAPGSVCPRPTVAGGQAVGEPQSSDALDEVAPAAPAAVRIRVLNGGGQRGQANLVASQLGDLGFTEAADPSNDPFYPNGDLLCRGNIRYGPAGAAAARTVSLVLPCVPLVLDGRADDTVDVAVGASFGDVNPSKAANEALDQLGSPSGQTDAAENAPLATPSVDPELLAKARDVRC